MQVSVSAGHGCALGAGGSVACWGDYAWGQASAPDGEYVAVSVGGVNSCAVDVEAAVVCWGDNRHGQLRHVPKEFTVSISHVLAAAKAL